MVNKPSILVIDDDEWVRKFFVRLFRTCNYEVMYVSSGLEGVEKIKKGAYFLVITDLKIEDYNGLDILKIAKAQSYDPEVLLITGYGTIASAIEAIKHGAFDYITKPLDPKRIMVTINQALERNRLKEEVQNLRHHVMDKYGQKNIIAVSLKMKKILELVDMVSRTDSTVLIDGESGTGKELIAKAIHFSGLRGKKPFIDANCAALPEPLLESELFGHVKGAFTGAVYDKKGLFEEADGGTILLDEIGDIPLSIQAKLLRVLQDHTLRRVGSNATINVDVRIIASTNRKLTVLIKDGLFREDLFYRLNVIPITIPPLRERKEDIHPLVNHFVEKYNRKLKKSLQGFSPGALEELMKREWPGNIRELENLVERTVALYYSPMITHADLTVLLHLGECLVDASSGFEDLNLARANDIVEREYVLKALEKNNWNQLQAARDLCISSSSLWRKIKKHSIKMPSGFNL